MQHYSYVNDNYTIAWSVKLVNKLYGNYVKSYIYIC
jgi:hypothetical protein